MPPISPSRLRAAAVGFVLASWGCAGPVEDAPDAGATGPDSGALASDAENADAGPTYADADWIFDPEHFSTIEIDIDEASWDLIRFQTRNALAILGDECGEHPAYSPFTYVQAAVTVDGRRLEDVGVRKKGFLGSLDEEKPSLKIKFDEYRDGQNLSGLTRMTLNNCKQDPSYMDQCLGYALFARAGVPAPRCNFAEVSVNGAPLGVYVNVEPVKKPFLARFFDDNDGNLYEGTLSDFRDGWTATFERKTNESEPPGSEDRSDLQAVVDALALPDAEMLNALESVIDLDSFYSFWAVETITTHWDGYAGNNNNFYVYADPSTGAFTFIPWGADQLFGNASADPGLTHSALTRRLYLYGPSRERYLERYEEILDLVWDDEEMLAEVDRIEAQVAAAVPDDEAPAHAEAVAELRTAIAGREARLRDELAAAGPDDADALAEPLCMEDRGAVSASFAATWNSASQNVSFTISLDGADVALDSEAVYTGASEDVEGQAILYLVAENSLGRMVVAYVALPEERVAPGVLEVGADNVESALIFFDETGEEAEDVYLMSGTLTLDAAGTDAGATWQGNVSLRAWSLPWAQ